MTSTPTGINCPATCMALFPMASSVTLSAAAAAGSTFVGVGRHLRGRRHRALHVYGRRSDERDCPVPAHQTGGDAEGERPASESSDRDNRRPMLPTLDVSESAYTAPVSWYSGAHRQRADVLGYSKRALTDAGSAHGRSAGRDCQPHAAEHHEYPRIRRSPVCFCSWTE